MRNFFSRLLIVVLAAGIVLGVTASASLAAETDLSSEEYFAQQETYSGIVEVPGGGPMRYYAQNDPLWRALLYERGDSSKSRVFGDGACCPTAMALAFANLVPEDQLCKIKEYAAKPYSLCPCSVNSARCYSYHERYVLKDEDYVRFLPLVFGDFAMGNNIWGIYSRGEPWGTDTYFVSYICDIYGVSMSVTEDYNAAIQALKAGKTVVGYAAAGGCFTNQGHFQLFVYSDNDRLYMLDPYYRTEYNTTGGNKVEIIEPGLVALKHSNVSYAYFLKFYIFELIE